MNSLINLDLKIMMKENVGIRRTHSHIQRHIHRHTVVGRGGIKITTRQVLSVYMTLKFHPKTNKSVTRNNYTAIKV